MRRYISGIRWCVRLAAELCLGKETEGRFGMRKFRICMIVLLLAGVLLGGIGAGACLVEFSDLEYKGLVMLGGEKTETQELVYEMKNRDVDRINLYTGGYTHGATEVIPDRSIDLDEVMIEVTYNPEYCEPMLESYGSYENETWTQEDVHIWTHVKNYDSLQTVMDVKDQILEDLKEKKISSYQVASVTEVKVYVHPANEEKVKIM